MRCAKKRAHGIMVLKSGQYPDMKEDNSMARAISIEHSKSYKTEANLQKALKDKGLLDFDCRYIVCCNSKGRYTAVFMVTDYLNREGGYAGFAAVHGFMGV